MFCSRLHMLLCLCLLTAFTGLALAADPTVEFVVANASASESAGATSTVIWLSDVHDEDVSVEYFVTGAATGDGVDHNLSADSVTIPAGDIAAEIDFTITDDSTVEGNESIVVVLASADNATFGENISQSLTIIDDDLVTSSTADLSSTGAASTTTTSLGSGSFSLGGYGCTLIR